MVENGPATGASAMRRHFIPLDETAVSELEAPHGRPMFTEGFVAV